MANTAGEEKSIRHKNALEFTGEAIDKFQKWWVFWNEVMASQWRIKQDFLRQIYSFRNTLFRFLIILMLGETVILFGIIIFTSIPEFPFRVNPTTLQILVGATIIQISTMVVVIVKSVYPGNLNDIIEMPSYSDLLKSASTGLKQPEPGTPK